MSSIKQVIDQKTEDDMECNERDGWCVVGTTDKLRDIISEMIIKLVKAKKQGTVKFITQSATFYMKNYIHGSLYMDFGL